MNKEIKLKIKGIKGDSPTDEQLVELIKPLIPEPLVGEKGDTGETPTDEKLVSLITPLIPEPKDGETPSDERLFALIKPLIPKVEPIEPVIIKINESITEIINKEYKVEDIKGLPEKLKKLEYSHAKAKSDYEQVAGHGGGGSTIPDLQQVTDIGSTTTNPIGTPRIDYTTTYTPTGSEPVGSTYWNSTDETVDIKMPDDITLQIGQETQIKVRNNTGSTILNGQAVYISGSLGNRPTVALARGDAHSTAIVIGVATQDIPNNTDGKITTQGYVRNIDTSAFTEGDMLWLSKTVAGGFVNTEPAVPHHSSVVATVTRSHGVQGTILVNITHHSSLEHLSDVNGTPLTTTGQFPSWNQTAGYFDFDRNILTRTVELSGDFRSYYQFSPYKIMLNMENATNTPNGIQITSIYVNCGTVDPTTELSAKIVYCDAQGTGAFPSTSPTDVATISTTTGNYSQTGMTTNVGTGKIVYLEMTANPTDYLTLWTIKINFTIL